MAADDLKSFTMQGVIAGLLLTCMLAFSLGFIFVNNSSGLDDGTNEVFQTTSDSNELVLLESGQNADELLNITSNTNPEVSDLGSRDSVSTAFSASGTAKESFNKALKLISWVFTGTSGKILIGTLTGIIGLLSYFFIYKHIRQGN